LLQELREETLRLSRASMLLAPEQGQFMALVARLIGVEHYLEVGTFTGYSALAIALALGPSGTIFTCDIDPDTTKIAQRYWDKASVADRIELRLGPALSTLDGIACTKEGAHSTRPSSTPTRKICSAIASAASSSSVPTG
jgi:predicted O-methyltransferase YrrM